MTSRSEQNNWLVGGDGNDTLIGYGSVANQNEVDILIGGSGRDLFVLGNSSSNAYLNNGNSDYALIKGFTIGEDKIQLHQFTGWLRPR
ncbi:MAG TPA: hypothetical protein DCY88_05260 [Cyanobacteria bacterium UBA11372]|nr:hypothetical protein [Cyanobacteria bacterium UBA11372]